MKCYASQIPTQIASTLNGVKSNPRVTLGNYFDSRDNSTMSPRGSKANGIVSEEVIAEWANNGMVFK